MYAEHLLCYYENRAEDRRGEDKEEKHEKAGESRKMTKTYYVKQLKNKKQIKAEAPGSKSITNRALLLAALSNRKCMLKGVLFSDDSRAFLDCLQKLGFEVEIQEKKKEVTIQGAGGQIPNRKASVFVGSAGTAARFLTVMLALAGGEYELKASLQMCKRPMEPLLSILREAGAVITCHGEEGHFPFQIQSQQLSMNEVTIDTGISSQFASALLMSAVLLKRDLIIKLEGDRTEGSYIKMTLAMMKQFGIQVFQENGGYRIPACQSFGLEEYRIEPDVSGACYFYAMAPILKTDVIVSGVHMDSLQGDIKFLQELTRLGCSLEEKKEGVLLRGSSLQSYPGIQTDMKDFSDQTMTMAVTAVFADTPTTIKNIGHIRFQESNRILAIITELTRMGIVCRELPEENGIYIEPGEVKEAEIETYEDHRMAMAFTLVGLKTGRIIIKNPGCCAKTFENYFEEIEGLYE